jgi:hypothetical protein
MPPISIENVYISPEYNSFGHHGQLARANPLREITDIECIAGRMIRGDKGEIIPSPESLSPTDPWGTE